MTAAVTSCSRHKAHAMVVSGTGGNAGIADSFGLIFASGLHAKVDSGCGSLATIGADQSGASSAAPGSSSPATDESGASKGGVAVGSGAFIARASVDQANASVSANSSLQGKGLSRSSECHFPDRFGATSSGHRMFLGTLKGRLKTQVLAPTVLPHAARLSGDAPARQWSHQQRLLALNESHRLSGPMHLDALHAREGVEQALLERAQLLRLRSGRRLIAGI